MKNFIFGFLVGSAIIIVVSCQNAKENFSNSFHEDAVIAEIIYPPAYHTLDPRDNIIFVNLDQEYYKALNTGVIFKCQHGNFIATSTKAYEVFKNHKGRKVNIVYREVYRDSYNALNTEGKMLIEHALVHYEFFDYYLKK
ncbi:MAG: hypothetical protein AAB522_02110 [Patescibacteria group bacterium]